MSLRPPDATVLATKKSKPQKRDPEATSQALLDAAFAEFAEHGFAGARVDRIAAIAGANKQLVYHYFGSKDELYRITLERVYKQIRYREQELHLSDLHPVAAMETLIAFSFDYLAEHPEFISMLNDENRLGAVHLKASRDVASMHSPLVKLIEETLARGIKAGVFNDRFGPVNLYLSIAGLSYFYFSNQNTLSVIFDRNLGSPAEIARRRQHVIDFAMAAIKIK